MTTTPYVFVSYASADRDRVRSLVAALQGAGVPIWLDQQDIEGGENYALAIAEGIERCAALILCCSATSLASRNVRQEVALAWKYERPYVPLLLEPVTIPKEIEYWLEAAQWVEVLDRPATTWLPNVLTALALQGIVPPPPTSAELLAGRERELAILRAHLAAARAGNGQLVLIGGEAGVGKTTLVEVISREAAQQGLSILTGRSFDRAESPAYGPWLYLFDRYHPAAALPSLPAAFATAGVVGAVASQDTLFRQVRDFLVALTAQRPTVLFLDDLHWSDPASLDLLRFLAQALATLPLLVLVTYRSDELTRRHPLYALLPLLVREAAAARLDLGRLDDAAVRALVTNRYGLAAQDTDRLVAYLQARAEGNALFLGELLRALAEAGVLREEATHWTLGELTQVAVPALLRQVIDGRLTRLGEEAQRLLAVAAIIGHEVPLVVWATVSGVEEDALFAVVEAGVAARVLVELPDGVRVQFAHALVREALYEGMLALRRRRWHRLVGEALAAAAQPDAEAVAYHFQQADDPRAEEWLLRAGERAQVAYAWRSAAERFEAALATMERRGADPGARGSLLLRIGRLYRYSDSQRSLAHLDTTLALATAAGQGALAVEALASRGVARCLALDFHGGLADLAASVAAWEALPAVERARIADPDMPAAFPGQALAALWLALVGRYADALTAAGRYLDAVPAPGQVPAASAAAYADALHGRGYALAGLGQPEEARRALTLARDAYRAAEHHMLVGQSATNELRGVLVPYQADRLAERERLVAEAAEGWGRARGLLSDLPPGMPRGDLLLVEGRWDEAVTHAAALRAVSGSPIFGLIGAVLRAQLAYARGERDLARRLVREVLPDGHASVPGDTQLPLALPTQRVGAALALEADELTEARAWLEAHDRWLVWSGAVPGRAEGQLSWAAYHRAVSDSAQAQHHAEQALVHATNPRQPLALLAAHRLLGELATERGDHTAASDHLAQALALAEACAAPYERALTLLARAELHAAMSDRVAALADLAEVRGICEPLGARPTLARAAALAARLEETP